MASLRNRAKILFLPAAFQEGQDQSASNSPSSKTLDNNSVPPDIAQQDTTVLPTPEAPLAPVFYLLNFDGSKDQNIKEGKDLLDRDSGHRNALDLSGNYLTLDNKSISSGALPVQWKRETDGSMRIEYQHDDLSVTEVAARNGNTIHVSTKETSIDPTAGIWIGVPLPTGLSVQEKSGVHIATESDYDARDGGMTDRKTTRRLITSGENGFLDDAGSTRTEHFENGLLESSQFTSFGNSSSDGGNSLGYTGEVKEKYDEKGLIFRLSVLKDYQQWPGGSFDNQKTQDAMRNIDGSYTMHSFEYVKKNGDMIYQMDRTWNQKDGNILSGIATETDGDGNKNVSIYDPETGAWVIQNEKPQKAAAAQYINMPVPSRSARLAPAAAI